jgi:hypothetical protein
VNGELQILLMMMLDTYDAPSTEGAWTGPAQKTGFQTKKSARVLGETAAQTSQSGKTDIGLA